MLCCAVFCFDIQHCFQDVIADQCNTTQCSAMKCKGVVYILTYYVVVVVVIVVVLRELSEPCGSPCCA